MASFPLHPSIRPPARPSRRKTAITLNAARLLTSVGGDCKIQLLAYSVTSDHHCNLDSDNYSQAFQICHA